MIALTEGRATLMQNALIRAAQLGCRALKATEYAVCVSDAFLVKSHYCLKKSFYNFRRLIIYLHTNCVVLTVISKCGTTGEINGRVFRGLGEAGVCSLTINKSPCAKQIRLDFINLEVSEQIYNCSTTTNLHNMLQQHCCYIIAIISR